ncbi:MAG: (Fe-S)-binding protein [Peptococcaceae bacterium]|nr:(Fe-S)-binding protein [Peptococcaceae bacterium]
MACNNTTGNLQTDLARIKAECSECGLCVSGCAFLSENTSPAEMARRGISKEDAYACSLCAKCRAVCPLELNPMGMFQARREQAIQNQELDAEEFNYFMPDNKDNVMSTYRRYYAVDYNDLKRDKNSSVFFFPGCTLMTYSPALTREIYNRIRWQQGCGGIITDCCGLPLNQMGFRYRASQFTDSLVTKIEKLGIKSLVTACPNCYYKLKKALQPLGVRLFTVYETIDFPPGMQIDLPRCTIHDSCPDRFDGLFAAQARTALRNQGYKLVEMANILRDSPCCGSGGQVSHFRPDLADNLVINRLTEARNSGAEILVSYCMSCVLNFARLATDLKVRHVMNLLLGIDEDYSEVKKRAAAIFAAK